MFAPFLGMNGCEEELVDAMIFVYHVFCGSLWSAHDPIAAFFRLFECVQATGKHR